MKRKLLLSSTLISSLIAAGASAQVVNFHAANNGFVSLPAFGVGYNTLYAGQGAYSDPGNDIWNGFGISSGGYLSTYFYSGQPVVDGGSGPWPQAAGNPGNPYAWCNLTSSTGASLFNFATGSFTVSGNANSAGQFTPITLSSTYSSDNGAIGGPTTVLNGSPYFLLGEAGITGASESFTFANVPPGVYGLYIYAANFNNDRGAAFSFEPDNGGVAHNGIAATVNEDNPGGHPDINGFLEGSNYVIFENLSPDTNGDIVVTGTPITNPYSGNSGETDVNGLQLIANPLPTSAGLNPASNVLTGGTAIFTFSPVFADEGTATPGFQWQFSTNAGATWTNVLGATSPTLTITGVTALNAGLYQCLITDNVTHAVGATPPASLAIITSATNVLQPTDSLVDVSNNISLPGNTVPAPIYMTVADAVDGTLYQYENFGVNGNSTTTGFKGPAGFIVTPGAGETILSGFRIFTSSTHPEADPTNYVLQGSSGTNGPWTNISSGSLNLPITRNWGGGLINVSNEALQEVDFANSQYYRTYQLLFTDVRSDATDSNGVQVAEVQLIGVATGAPNIVSSPPALTVAPACANLPIALAVAATGVGPLTYNWVINGSASVQNSTNPSYAFNPIPGTNTYTVTVTGAVAPPETSTPVTVVGTAIAPTVLSLSNASSWTLNPGTTGQAVPTIVPGTGLTLTDGKGGEWSSAFYKTIQYVGGFVASFIYTPQGGADGTTFCLQNDSRGASAVGTLASGGGSGLGFDVISPSFAFEMDLYVHGSSGPGGGTPGPGIAFGTNGSTPFTVSPAPSPGYFPTGNIILNSGDPIFVQLYYNGQNLSVFMEDTNTTEEFTTNVAVNLPAVIGGSSAFVGFTGSDGGVTSTQIINDFSFSSSTPPVLSIANSTGGNVVVSWPVSVSPAFTLYQSSGLSGPWTPANMSSLIQNGCENQITLPHTGTAEYYQLALSQPAP